MFFDSDGDLVEERDVACHRDPTYGGAHITGDLEPPLPDEAIMVVCDEQPISWQYGDVFTLDDYVSIVPAGYRHDKRGFLVADVLVGIDAFRSASSSRRWPLASLKCDLVAYRGSSWFGTRAARPCSRRGTTPSCWGSSARSA